MRNVTETVCGWCKRTISINTDAVYEDKESQWYHPGCFMKAFPEAKNPICYCCGQAIKITKANYKNGKWYHKKCVATEGDKQETQQGDVLQNRNEYSRPSPAKTEKVCYSCKQLIRLQLDAVYEDKGSQWYHVRCFKEAFPKAKVPTCHSCGQAIKRTKAQYRNGKWYHKKCLMTQGEKQEIQQGGILQNGNEYSLSSEVKNPICYSCGQAIKKTKAKYSNGKWYHKKCLAAPGQKRNKLKEIRHSDVLSVMRNSNGYSRPAPAKNVRVISGGLVRPK